MEKGCLLVVEDQAGLRIMLGEAFKSTGIQVHLAANGPEALALARERKPDVVLLDMKLPGMDGLDTLSALRSQGTVCPCSLMTGMGSGERLQHVLEMGGVELVPKPFDVLKLRERILSLMKQDGHGDFFLAG